MGELTLGGTVINRSVAPPSGCRVPPSTPVCRSPARLLARPPTRTPSACSLPGRPSRSPACRPCQVRRVSGATTHLRYDEPSSARRCTVPYPARDGTAWYEPAYGGPDGRSIRRSETAARSNYTRIALPPPPQRPPPPPPSLPPPTPVRRPPAADGKEFF